MRRRRVRVAIELATWSEDEITEREGVKWISPSHTQSAPHASARSAIANASRNAPTWSTPRRISSTKIPKCIRSSRSDCALEKEGEVLREQDALIEDDLAPRDLKATVDAAEHVLALADEHVGLRLDACAI